MSFRARPFFSTLAFQPLVQIVGFPIPFFLDIFIHDLGIYIFVYGMLNLIIGVVFWDEIVWILSISSSPKVLSSYEETNSSLSSLLRSGMRSRWGLSQEDKLKDREGKTTLSITLDDTYLCMIATKSYKKINNKAREKTCYLNVEFLKKVWGVILRSNLKRN